MVQFSVPGKSEPVTLPLMLPAIMTKFMAPAQLAPAEFLQHWEATGGPRETQNAGPASCEAREFAGQLSQGFNMHVVEHVPTHTHGAGVFNAMAQVQGGAPQRMAVACMVRLEGSEANRTTRIVVRAQHPQVSQLLTQILSSYLIQAQ